MIDRRARGVRTRPVQRWLWYWVLLSLASVGTLLGQELPWHVDEPYDEIVLSDEFDQAKVAVLRLGFGPDAMPQQTAQPLRVRIVNHPDREYEVQWKDIARINFFEDLLVSKASTLIREGKSEEAFDVLSYLWETVPTWRGLARLTEQFLLTEAGRDYRNLHREEALVVLEELFGMRPDPRVAEAMQRVLERLFREHFEQRDYHGARQWMSWLASRPQLELSGLLANWHQQLRDLADQEMQTARQALEHDRFREALDRLAIVQQILPGDPAGRQLTIETLSRFPRVEVGVTRAAPAATDAVWDWSIRRTNRLVHRSLIELTGFGADGGTFRSAYGELELHDDGVGATLRFDATHPEDLNRFQQAAIDMLSATTIARGAWRDEYLRRLLADVRPESFGIRMRVEDSTLRWLPLLERPLPTHIPSLQPFSRDNDVSTSAATIFSARPEFLAADRGRIAEIVERPFSRYADLLQALEAGRVGVVDRVLPADTERLAGAGRTVGRYGVVSNLLLVPNPRSRLARDRNFRRGIQYGIPRQQLLSQLASPRQMENECQVISGPFPVGTYRNDPIGYAYNSQVPARGFDPALAAVLVAMSFELYQLTEQDDTVVADTTNTSPDASAPEAPKRSAESRTVVLTYADDALLDVIAHAISHQLNLAGVATNLRRLPAGFLRPPDDATWHLWLVDYVVREPINDVFEMFSADGLVMEPSAYILQALDELAGATRWSDAREILHRIHEIVDTELELIPLWQLTNYFAAQTELRGIGESPTSLYDNIDEWSLALPPAAASGSNPSGAPR